MAHQPSDFRAYGAALERIQRRYGGLCRVVTEEVVVTTTPVVVAEADSERIFFAFINLSADAVMLCPGVEASALRGFRLSPLGGALLTNEEEDNIMPTLQWSAQGLAINLECFRITVRRDVQTNPMEPGY
jgi:hypothetical protein